MDRLIEFVGNHPLLVAAFVAVLVAVIVSELLRLKGAASSLSAASATLLYNRQDALFIDIRAEAEFRKAHLPGAMHVPAAELEQRLSKLEKHKQRPIIVYCDTGLRSGAVAAKLKKLGFAQVHQLQGGLAAWQNAGFPLESK